MECFDKECSARKDLVERMPDTRQLRITPLVAQGTELGIVIFARNTLYRQFRIELKVAEASPPETTTEPSAKVAGDVVHTLLDRRA